MNKDKYDEYVTSMRKHMRSRPVMCLSDWLEEQDEYKAKAYAKAIRDREGKIDEYAYDLIGCCSTDPNLPFWGWEDYAKDIMDFINKLDKETT